MMIWSDTEAGQAPITVTVPSREALLRDISLRFAQHAGFSVATLNLDHVVKLQRDPAFRDAYGAHTHVTADGNPIVWLSRLAGQREVSLVPGADLIEPLAKLAAEQNVPVALFGTTETALRTAADGLQTRHPNLVITLTLAPAMGFEPDSAEADAAIARLGESGARLVFLALGAPKQERFAARAQTMLPQTGFLSIGAGLDFVAGAQMRAPRWVRAISAEWLWRLVGNPRRLVRRYAACIVSLPQLTARAMAERRRQRA